MQYCMAGLVITLFLRAQAVALLLGQFEILIFQTDRRKRRWRIIIGAPKRCGINGKQFKAERNFYEWQSDMSDTLEWEPQPDTYELRNAENLLNSIENQKVFEVLKKVDKLTLKILLMRMEGYSDSEIAHAVGLDKYAVSMRIYRLRKKLKKYF